MYSNNTKCQLLLIKSRLFSSLGWMSAVKISANKSLSDSVASMFSNWKAESFQNGVTMQLSLRNASVHSPDKSWE